MAIKFNNDSQYLGAIETTPKSNGAYRGIFGDWINADSISAEDFMRSEQQANNALYRDLAVMDIANDYNSKEAQKQRDFEEKMSNTAYTRAVEDMKRAGINPIMAFSNGGADTPTGSSASSSTSRSSGGRYSPTNANTVGAITGIAGLFMGLGKLFGGLIPTKVTKQYFTSKNFYRFR